MVALFAFFVCVVYSAPWYIFLIGFLLLLIDSYKSGFVEAAREDKEKK